MATKLVGTVLHHQIGWLRRSELDPFHNGYVYEEPDGDLVVSMDPRHKHRMLLNVWLDTSTGEKHTSFSRTPFFTGQESPPAIQKPRD